MRVVHSGESAGFSTSVSEILTEGMVVLWRYGGSIQRGDGALEKDRRAKAI